MNNIQETLFQTIETIVGSRVNEIKFDKTIEATVVADDKASSGEYQLKYQDIMFTAYTANNTSKFKKDDNVLVLIPDGDMSKRKTIISSSKREGEEFIDIEKIIVDVLSMNYVDEAEDFKIRLSTFKDETLNFNLKKQLMIDEYPRQTMLRIGSVIYTNINEEDLTGDYGIAIDCVMLNDAGERIPHTFKFSKANVTGNPYQARGYKSTNIVLLEERLVEIVNARAYSEGFTMGNEPIEFSNITVEYVSIREQDQSEYSSNILATKGNHFRSGSLYPDEALPLTMEFKQKGEVLNTDAVDYKWFVLDAEVNSTENEHYHPDGGIGWRWIKPGDYVETMIKGANTRTLEVFATFVPNFSTFKCIASYKEVQLQSSITLVDHTENISVEVESSNGVSFVNGVGSTVLTCEAKMNNLPIEEALIYEWSKVTPDGSVTLIKKSAENSIPVLATDIGVKTIYLCEVSLSQSVRPIGTGSITLVGISSGSTQGVVIVGGFRTALYDAEGYAPEDFVASGFQFDVYKDGTKITENIDWKWIVPPTTETLLVMETPTLGPNQEQTSKNKVLNLSLERQFNISKNNNTVAIEVIYTEAGISHVLREEIPIAITKVGSNGADGASGKPGVDGHTYVYEIQGGNPVISYDGNGLNPSPKILNEFVLMFSKDGDDQLANEVSRVEWYIQERNESLLSFEGKEPSIRTVTTVQTLSGSSDNPHRITLVADDNWNIAKFNNFISVKITYQDQIFRETYPISVSKNGQSGYTVNTLPSAFAFNVNENGLITNNRNLVISFEVIDGGGTKVPFTVSSFTTPPGVEIVETAGQDAVYFKILDDSLVPDSGVVDFSLLANGKFIKQNFAYSKVANGSSAYMLTLSSSNGLTFKRGTINTVIEASVMKGTETIDPMTIQNAFIWTKRDKTGVIDSGWVPTFVDGVKHKIAVTDADVLERATFDCAIDL